MINLKHKIQHILAGAAVIAASALGLASCSLINDDLDPCPEGVALRFVYDYNMLYANAFPAQVDCLTLLVYDQNGNFVTSKTETTSVLADENWRMTLDLPAGKTYKFVAYGGMECPQSSFHFMTEPAAGTNFSQLAVAMNTNLVDAIPGVDLHNLYYGELTMEVPKGALDYTAGTVSMMRDTNSIRILLQNVDGSPVEPEDFNFAIYANNTELNGSNEIIPTTNGNVYYPWSVGQKDAGLSEADDIITLAYAEFSVNRLMAGSNTRLHISEVMSDKTVLDIPIVNYLLLMKSDHFNSMPDQEYLDRENHWDVILFLDNGRWVDAYIVVNNWYVRIDHATFD